MPFYWMTHPMPLILWTDLQHCTTSECCAPIVAAYAINTYRQPAGLFVIGGQELRSVEGTTRGDPLAMSLHAISLQPLITKLQLSSATISPSPKDVCLRWCIWRWSHDDLSKGRFRDTTAQWDSGPRSGAAWHRLQGCRSWATSTTTIGETLNNGANTSPDARLDIHARGFWERHYTLSALLHI